MQGKATIGKHPLHPILVTLPIGFFVGALVSDVITLVTANDFWPRMSVALIGFGLVAAVPAALLGFVDYATAPMPPPVKKIATGHMLLNLAVIGIFAIAFLVRFAHPVATLGIALTVLGDLILAVSGFLGGELSYRHGVGAADDARRSRRVPAGTAAAPPQEASRAAR
jgi:uncharacterized membrane protein